jgi:hypothetical protein
VTGNTEQETYQDVETFNRRHGVSLADRTGLVVINLGQARPVIGGHERVGSVGT